MEGLPTDWIPIGKCWLICRDTEDVLPFLADSSIDSIVTDPPYGLSSETAQGNVNRVFRGLSKIVFPDFHKLDTAFFEQNYLHGVPLNGSLLGREKALRIIKSGVRVPERAIDFQSYVEGWQKEVQSCPDSPLTIAERMLRQGFNFQDPQFLGDYLLDLGDTGELAAGDCLRSSLTEFFTGGFRVPVVPVFPASGGSPLSGCLLRHATGFADFVGFNNDSFCQTGRAARVVAFPRAIHGFMLGFDLGRGTLELNPAIGADNGDLFVQEACPKLIGALPATSRLPAEFKPYRVRVILPVADRAIAGDFFFHIWLHEKAFDKLQSSLPAGGFMGKSWDHGVPSISIWKQCLRVLKPGGHLLSFGGSRTYHRVAVNIEDAGFEIRDQIFWVYGSGFPKSLDVGKAIDKAAGAEREVVGRKTGRSATAINDIRGGNLTEGVSGGIDCSAITAPATDAARYWNGWGTALKPSHEPIVLARKPLIGTVVENVLQYGTGAINVDACRVDGHGNKTFAREAGNRDRGQYRTGTTVGAAVHTDTGRWPANLIHDGSDEVLAMFPEAGGGDRRGQCNGNRPAGFGNVGAGSGSAEPNSRVYSDVGSAARFFYQAKAPKSERWEFCRVCHCGIPASESKNHGHGFPDNRHLVGHPTQKPLELMRYLCRLVTPPGGVVLDPYSGSGTTAVAAAMEGFAFAGVDNHREYFDTMCYRVWDAVWNPK